MKMKFIAASTTALLVAFAAQAQDVEPGFKSLFNGKDLTGWAGRNHWIVEDGVISGTTTTENPAKGNNFLIAKDANGSNTVVGDFELRFSYKFTGNSGNSGLQYRSLDKGNFVVHGYQGDFEVGNTYSDSILYSASSR